MMPEELQPMDMKDWKETVFEEEISEFDADIPHRVLLIKEVAGCVKSVDMERREVTIAYSAESVDRDGDVIRQKGIDLKAYRKNPVVLWAHGSRGAPENVVGRSMKLFRSDDNLKSLSVDRFTEPDLNSLGDMVFRMLTNTPAFLNAASIGFLPIKVERMEADEDDPDAGRFFMPLEFKKVEKLEHSIVPVPANADALRGAKAAGIDISPLTRWAEQILDSDGGDAGLSRADLEKAYWISQKERKTFQVPEIRDDLLLELRVPLPKDEVPEGDLAEASDKGSTPGNPSGFSRADEGTAWSAPTLGAFGISGPFDDLPAARRSRIARHYAWTEKMPPTAFGQLKLPHHRANDAAVVLRGVNAALAALNGARGGVNIPSGDRKPANTHLNGHRRAFGQDPIELREMNETEIRELLERFAREIAEYEVRDESGMRLSDKVELAAQEAIDAEVGDILASFEAEKEEDVPEEEKTTKPTGEVTVGTKEEADEVFDVAPEAMEEDFDFPSIKDEESAVKDDTATQLAELRQGQRDITVLMKRLVDVIKVAGTPEGEAGPEEKDEGKEEFIIELADEPETKEEPAEKVARLVAEGTVKAVDSAIARHTGRLPN